MDQLIKVNNKRTIVKKNIQSISATSCLFRNYLNIEILNT